MSDASQGPGWWQASDGKWYPPSDVPAAPASPGYGAQQPWGALPAQRRTSGKAIAILVLGIVSLVFLCGYGVGVIAAIVALALAPSTRREIAESGGQLEGAGFVKAGTICSLVSVGLTILALIIVVVLAVIGSLA